MNCASCGAKLKGTEAFCPQCGTVVRSMAELVDLAKQGDEQAISDLYGRTYNAVYASVKAKARVDEDTVLDVIQDAYVKGFQSLDQLQNPEQFQAWMKTIAMNRLRDVLKRNRPTLFSELSPEEEEDTVVDFEDDRIENLPDIVVDRQETARLIGEILDTLTDEQRMAVVLYYYEELSVKEIANLLECSENTVKSRLNYARKKIKLQVEDLERRGTKLYGLAPLPFLLLLLHNAEIYGPSLYTPAAAAAGGAGAGAAAAQVSSSGATGTSASAAAANTASAAAAGAGTGLVTKIVAGALAVVLAAGGGAAAGRVLSSRQNPSPAAVETTGTTSQVEEAEAERPEEDAKAETPSIEALYQEVLNEFVDASKGENHARRNRDQYRYLNRDIFDSWILIDDEMYMADDLFYAEHDINGDGTPELLLGVLDHYYDADDEEDEEHPYSYYFSEYLYLLGVYGIRDSEVIDLAVQSGIRYEAYDTSLYLLEDNTLCVVDQHLNSENTGWESTKTEYHLSERGDALEELNSKTYQDSEDEPELSRLQERDIVPSLDWVLITEPIDKEAVTSLPSVTSADALEAFQPVLEQYAAVNSDRPTYEDRCEELPYVMNSGIDDVLYPSSYFPDAKLKYTLYDINNDGNEELILAVQNCDGDALPYRCQPAVIFTYDGLAVEQTEPILSDINVYLDDGFFYSYKWMEQIIKYSLNPQGELEEEEYWTYDYEKDQYRNSDSSFTEKQWEKRVRDHDLLATQTWEDVGTARRYDSAKDAYRDYLTICRENGNNLDGDGLPTYIDMLTTYTFFDLDGDGAKELIVKLGSSEASYRYRFLTYRDGELVLLGVLHGGHSSLALDEDNALIVQNCHMGHETDTRMTVKDGRLFGDVIYDKDTHEYKDYQKRPKEHLYDYSSEKLDLSEL